MVLDKQIKSVRKEWFERQAVLREQLAKRQQDITERMRAVTSDSKVGMGRDGSDLSGLYVLAFEEVSRIVLLCVWCVFSPRVNLGKSPIFMEVVFSGPRGTLKGGGRYATRGWVGIMVRTRSSLALPPSTTPPALSASPSPNRSTTVFTAPAPSTQIDILGCLLRRCVLTPLPD